jgi:hypothetical protein
MNSAQQSTDSLIVGQREYSPTKSFKIFKTVFPFENSLSKSQSNTPLRL